MKRFVSMMIALSVLYQCNEAPLIDPNYDQILNAPSSLQLFPSTTFGLVSNTNINLQEEMGSVLIFDTATQELVEETRFFTTNFGTKPLIDDARTRILIPDHDEYLLFYTYAIPGTDGQVVSFANEAISPAISDTLTNAIEVDERPSDVILVNTSNHGQLYLVANQMGSISVIDADTLTVMNLNDEDRFQGLKLASALNIALTDTYPARGVSQLFVDPVTNLVYAINGSSNFVYIVDPENLENEAMISFLDVGGNTTGIRSMTFDGAGNAYFLHAGLKSLIKVDVSNIINNGIAFEVIEPNVLEIMPLYGTPNDLVINAAMDTAYVSLQDLNEVVKIDLAAMSIAGSLTLSLGRGPSALYLDDAVSEILSLDFFSSTMSRIDVTVMSEIEVIQ